MNARKARQLRSTGSQKRRRRFRKEQRATAAEFNAAQEAMNAELVEAIAYQEEVVKTLSAEPQFAIIDPFSGRAIMQVAQSMIYPLDADVEGEAAYAEVADAAKPEIILPASTRRRMEIESNEFAGGPQDNGLPYATPDVSTNPLLLAPAAEIARQREEGTPFSDTSVIKQELGVGEGLVLGTAETP